METKLALKRGLLCLHKFQNTGQSCSLILLTAKKRVIYSLLEMGTGKSPRTKATQSSSFSSPFLWALVLLPSFFLSTLLCPHSYFYSFYLCIASYPSSSWQLLCYSLDSMFCSPGSTWTLTTSRFLIFLNSVSLKRESNCPEFSHGICGYSLAVLGSDHKSWSNHPWHSILILS